MTFFVSMSRGGLPNRLLTARSLFAALLLAVSTPALAQTAPPGVSVSQAVQTAPQQQTAQAAQGTPQTAQGAAATEAITVTGSRIQAPGLTSANPIDTITSTEIENTGLQNLSDILAERPQFQNNQGPSNSSFFVNGADINAANLRGLGPYRTLTLIDGVRQVGTESGVNNSGGTGIVDLNTIPPLLIDSIDVVTGGESAIYGADAVAGVLNFKLKKNYEGAEATAEYGTTTDGGGTTTSFDAIFGANFSQDRGNITFTTDYAKTATINGFERPNLTSNTSIFTAFPDGTHANLVCCAVNGTLNQSFAPVIANQIGNNAPFSLTTNTAGTQLLPFNPGTPIPGFPPATETFLGSGQGLNGGVFGIVAPDNLREVDEAILTYNLANDLGPFKTINFTLDAKYASSRGKENGADDALNTSPAQGNIGSEIIVPTNSVFVPTALKQLANANGVAQLDLSRSLADWDAFTTSYDYELFRDVVGFNGELKNGWTYNAYYNFGRYENTFINTSAHLDLLNQAVDAVVSPTTGQIVCADSLVNPGDGCVPINPFKVGALTQAQQRFVFFDTKEVDVFEENDAAFNTSGEIVHYGTPFTGTDVPLSAAFGIEWREEATNSVLDAPSMAPVGVNNQNLIGTNLNANAPTAGIYTTKEIYGELHVPVLRDLPFAEAVDLDGAIRGQDFSTTGDDYTWDANITWKVNPSITMRGSAGKSVRAPNADELFSGGGQSFVGIVDPCSSALLPSQPLVVAQNCAKQGVPVKIVNGIATGGAPANAGQAASIISGNPKLSAETGRSFTGGFVFTPTFLPHFASTLDFYQIHINDVIGEANPGNILIGCFNDSVQADCNETVRRADGSLDEVLTPYINESEEIVRGADWTASYRLTDEELPFLPPESRINLGSTLSWIPQHFILTDAQAPNAPGSDLGLAGQFGFPRWSGSFRSGYDEGPMSFSLTERFIGPTQLFIPQPPQTFNPSFLPTVWYTDLSATYSWRNLTFSTGVQNLFDQQPPTAQLALSEGQVARPVEEPVSTYDTQGRFVYTKLKVEF